MSKPDICYLKSNFEEGEVSGKIPLIEYPSRPKSPWFFERRFWTAELNHVIEPQSNAYRTISWTFQIKLTIFSRPTYIIYTYQSLSLWVIHFRMMLSAVSVVKFCSKFVRMIEYRFHVEFIKFQKNLLSSFWWWNIFKTAVCGTVSPMNHSIRQFFPHQFLSVSLNCSVFIPFLHSRVLNVSGNRS